MGNIPGRGGQTVESVRGQRVDDCVTDGSAKWVKRWWQVGYEAWFGEGSGWNFGSHVPTQEQQSVS